MIEKELNIYGDNIAECFKFIKDLKTSFLFNKVSLDKVSKFIVPRIILENNKYKFILNIYADYSKWKVNPIDFITHSLNAKLREYPDVIIFEKKNGVETILCAIEYSNALLAGNQAWQRQGRSFSFADVGVNFFYIIELGGKELDANRNEKSIRYPNPVVLLSYYNFLSKYKKKFFPIYSLSSNSTNQFRKDYAHIKSTLDYKNCILDLLNDGEVKETNREKIINKTKNYFLKLINQANNINEYEDLDELLNKNTDDYKYFSENKFGWKKTISINTTTTLDKLKNISEKYGVSIISKNLPFVIIPEKNRMDFLIEVKKVYNLTNENYNKLSLLKNLVLCFILGFKPRGDDARPDRGLNPLLKMIFSDNVTILSVIYGPATQSLWSVLNKDREKAKIMNGLINSILQFSNCLIVDSKNYPKNSNRFFFIKDTEHSKKTYSFISSSVINKTNEHDIDNALFLFFRFFSKTNFFESMINPPGGDWSYIDFIDKKNNIYRWTNLPRVSGGETKRPDHIYIFNDDNNTKNGLIIESKYEYKNLEEDIGSKLFSYVNNLIKYKPNCIKNCDEDNFLHNKNKNLDEIYKLKTAVSYYNENVSSIKSINNKMNFLKVDSVFEIFYDKKFKTFINLFTKDKEIFEKFKNLKIECNQLNFLITKV